MRSPKIAVLLVQVVGFAAGSFMIGCAAVNQPKVTEDAPTQTVAGKDPVAIPVNPAEDDRIYIAVGEIPRFPGGEQAMIDFLKKEMRYPKEALEKKEEGRVVVGFVISRTGDIRDPKILRGVSESLDKEALRLVNIMPNWQPGKQNGREVNVQFVLPIVFALK